MQVWFKELLNLRPDITGVNEGTLSLRVASLLPAAWQRKNVPASPRIDRGQLHFTLGAHIITVTGATLEESGLHIPPCETKVHRFF